MIHNKYEKSIENICDLSYLSSMMGDKKYLIKEILDTFLLQVHEELQSISNAIKRIDYSIIMSFAHTMKSSVSIMGISSLTPILQEMEDLGTKAENIEKIIILNKKLNLICSKAIEEIEKEKENYI